VRRSRAKNGPLTSSHEVKPDANSTLWLLAAALFFIAFASFLYWRSQGGAPPR
jgi:cbb3-type cytochrome oxidase subunit 3